MKGILVFCGALAVFAVVATAQNGTNTVDSQRALVNQYCSGCHNDKLKTGGFSFTEVDLEHPEKDAERAEKIIRKVRAGMMPPAGVKRPDAAALKSFAASLETRIDAAAAKETHVTAPELHRVNRTEYRNSVRDLLGMDVDVSSLLPSDPKTGGFDNMSDALTVTPAL